MRRHPPPKVSPRTENDATVSRGLRSVLLPSLTRVRAWQGSFCFGGRFGDGSSVFFSKKTKAPVLQQRTGTCCLVLGCVLYRPADVSRHCYGQLLVPWTRSKLSSIIIIIILTSGCLVSFRNISFSVTVFHPHHLLCQYLFVLFSWERLHLWP